MNRESSLIKLIKASNLLDVPTQTEIFAFKRIIPFNKTSKNAYRHAAHTKSVIKTKTVQQTHDMHETWPDCCFCHLAGLCVCMCVIRIRNAKQAMQCACARMRWIRGGSRIAMQSNTWHRLTATLATPTNLDTCVRLYM